MNGFYHEYEQTLADRGFTYGGGRMSPDGKYFYLNIPKNANSMLDKLFATNGWRIENLLAVDPDQTHVVVVLRDPVERWISGIAEYIEGYIVRSGYPMMWTDRPGQPGDEFVKEYNDVVEALLFDQVIFDDHTMPQYYFFDSVKNHKNSMFFYLDDNLRSKINQAFGFSDVELFSDPKEIRRGNLAEQSVTKSTIIKFLKQRIKEHSVLEDRIRSKYQEDCDLIEKVNGTR